MYSGIRVWPRRPKNDVQTREGDARLNLSLGDEYADYEPAGLNILCNKTLKLILL